MQDRCRKAGPALCLYLPQSREPSMRLSLLSLFLLLLTHLSPAAMAQEVETTFPAQTFTADPAHTSVTFSVDHLGFSNFTAGFDTVAATLELDPEAPETSKLLVEIPVGSLDLPTPPPDFREMLLGPQWFDAATYPTITYVSDSITMTGERTATVEGTMTMHGVSHPMTLQVTYNGGWGRQPFEPAARAGFSATGSIDRSDFGMDIGLPPPGTSMGVADEVTFRIETEMTGEPFE
jgi:polyisoprenoid-binding protein YceI